MSDRKRRIGENPISYGVATGRFSASRADFYLGQYTVNPETTTSAIERLTPVPEVMGSAAGRAAAARLVSLIDSDVDSEFDHLFSPGFFSPSDGARQVEASSDADADFDALFAPTSTDEGPSEFDHLFSPNPGSFPNSPE